MHFDGIQRFVDWRWLDTGILIDWFFRLSFKTVSQSSKNYGNLKKKILNLEKNVEKIESESIVLFCIF